MRVIRVGGRALLVEVQDVTEAQALYAQARQRDCQATDVVPGARTVLFDGVDDPDALAREVPCWPLTPPSPRSRSVVEVPTVYDGDDLEVVARSWKMSTAEVVRTHLGASYTVAFCGFAPGFAYCTGLPVELSVPRRESPRARVPAGSVGLAGAFTGIYPHTSPGGWQLVGRTELTTWNPTADPPALLAPGTRLRFVEVER